MDGVVLLVLIFCEYPLVIVLVEELKIADRTAHSRLCNNN